MQVVVCIVQLSLPGVASLKEKRRIVKSLVTRLPRQFNVTAAEVDCQDVWQTAVIGLAAIGNDNGRLHSLMEKSVAWIERTRPDAPVDSYFIEFR